jgi:hypothetical protein
VFVRTGYHTQVPEISGKLNGKKTAFTWATSSLLRSLGAEQLEPLSICSVLIRVCRFVNGCRRRVQRICGGPASICELHEPYGV